jgi:hypothetical protein
VDATNSKWDKESDVLTDEDKARLRAFNNEKNDRLKVDDSTPVGVTHTQLLMMTGKGEWYVVSVNFDGKEEVSIGVTAFEDLFGNLLSMLEHIQAKTGLEGMNLPGIVVVRDSDETSNGHTVN